jgi:hypothetical protein
VKNPFEFWRNTWLGVVAVKRRCQMPLGCGSVPMKHRVLAMTCLMLTMSVCVACGIGLPDDTLAARGGADAGVRTMPSQAGVSLVNAHSDENGSFEGVIAGNSDSREASVFPTRPRSLAQRLSACIGACVMPSARERPWLWGYTFFRAFHVSIDTHEPG